jgi:iron complex transport system substrate-binding protein
MRNTTLAGIVAGLVLLVAACGDDAAAPPATTERATIPATIEPATIEPATIPATTEPATTEPAPETTERAGEETDGTGFPRAIISLSPTATEMLFAIGAADQVLAVDDLSNYPPEAAEKMQGLSAFEPNIEAIAGMEPDLVVTDGTNPDLLEQFDRLDIDHWEGVAATSFDDVYAQIEELGAVTGRVGESAALVEQMKADVAAVVDGLPGLGEPLTYYHELDNTYYSVSSQTFIGAVYDQIGLVNIVDQAGEDLGLYPQLSAEFIIASNPDLIFLACTKYCGESAETVAARPGWDSIDALAEGGVIEMDDDIASRWGPRIVEYLQIAGEAVRAAAS